MSAIAIENRDGVTCVNFTRSELTEGHFVTEAGAALQRLVTEGDVRRLLIDFTGVNFFNSEMIGQFAILRKKCEASGASLKLCGLNENLHRVLQLVRLDRIFEILPDVETACAAFAREIGPGSAPTVADSADVHRKAASSGDAAAQFRLGRCYENGWGVEQNFTEAFAWYSQAVRADHVEAEFALANCYAYALGTNKDYAEALKWYQRAAEQGHPKAEYVMGMSYDFGIGVEPDPAKAEKWYTRAAARGDAQAQEALKNLKAS